MNLKGKIIILTGAAGGIGEALARRFSRESPRALLLLDLQESKLKKLARKLSIDDVETGTADVTEPGTIEAWVDHMEERYGGVDLFCSNAGIFANGGADAELSAWQKSLDVNVMAHIHAARACLPGMLSRGSGYFLQVDAGKPGSIINITSILADRVAGGVSPYCASKAGVRHLTRALALELARHGVRVNSLAPGYVATELNADFLASDAGEKLRARIPTRRFGECGNLDGALLLLASDAGSYMTGSEIVVDGGHLCSSL